MRLPYLFPAAAAALSVSVLTGCLGSGEGNGDVSFDRPALLANFADRIILPAYARLDAAASALSSAADSLAASPDSARAESARTALKAAWLAWQGASAFEFGPAAQVLLRQRLNTFPAEPAKIEANIAQGTWNLELPANYVAKGFPALDYLLHGSGDSLAPLLSALRDPARGEARGRYLREVAAEIADQVARARKAWEPGQGDFREDFVSRPGTDIGSSLGELVNQLNFDYELLKNAKVGIPLGVRTQGEPLPAMVEAYHAGYSLDLAEAHLAALERLFRGRDTADVEGPGLDDYLEALGARYGDGGLAEAIGNRFAEARAALAAVPDPLSRSITAEKAKVDSAYRALNLTVPLLKSDLPSALSVSITYQDTDGD